MTDFAAMLLPDRGEPAHLLTPLTVEALDAWLAGQGEAARTAVDAARFSAKPGELVILHGGDEPWRALVGVGSTGLAEPWALAAAAAKLPGGAYRLDGGAPGLAAHGWLMAQHRFDRYRSEFAANVAPRILLTADAAAIVPAVRMAEAAALVRDLVDTPANDMGPAELADAVREVALRHHAELNIIVGEALATGFPAVHAVGRAAVRAPRVIDLHWGDPAHPRLTLVGKGVVFDSGGLNIKHGAGMALMKKDMGGAAHALALAQLVMAENLPVRLRLIIPAVENAISGDAFRPGDVIATRAGLTVEIGNTDAEGRLILADALTLAQEDAPDLLLDFATLTGAARVALGPDLPALFTHDDRLAAGLLDAGTATYDPMWRLPLWVGYRDMLKSTIADVNNAGEGGFAGAITAALFLDRFISVNCAWAHLDLYAWAPVAKPGRAKGGTDMTLRACWLYLQKHYERS